MPGSIARGPKDALVHPIVMAITIRRVHTYQWSREELAKRSDVSVGTIERLENGRHMAIGFDRLLRICDALSLELNVMARETPL